MMSGHSKRAADRTFAKEQQKMVSYSRTVTDFSVILFDGNSEV